MLNYSMLPRWLSVSQSGDMAIRLWLLIVNLLLTALAGYLNPAINDDGAMYLMQAKAFETGGLDAAFQVYNWPFYAFLVFLGHKLLFLPYEASAYFINAILYGFLLDYLYRLVRPSLLGNSAGIWAAILLLCFTPINEHRDHIIRDAGYWAFLAGGLYHFQKAILDKSKKSVVRWHAYMALAVLFRIEGVFIYVILPLLMLFNADYRKRAVNHLISFKALPLLLVVLAVVVVLLGVAEIGNFKKLAQIPWQIKRLGVVFSGHAEALAEYVLVKFSAEDAIYIYAGGMAAYLLLVVLKGLSYPYLVLLGCAYPSRPKIESSIAVSVLIYTVALSLLVLFGTSLFQTFTLTRYVMPVICLLLVLMLPWLVGLLRNAFMRRKWWRYLFALLLFYALGDAFVSTKSSRIDWQGFETRVQSFVPPGARVGSNDHKVCYYSQCDDTRWVYHLEKSPSYERYWKSHTAKKYDYVALEFSEGEYRPELYQRVDAEEVKVFDLGRGKQVILFKTTSDKGLAETR